MILIVVSITAQLCQINGMTSIHTLAHLQEVQEKLIALQSIVRHFPHILQLLLQLTSFHSFYGVVIIHQLSFSAAGALSLLLRCSAPGHFHKDLFGCSHGAGHILNHIQRSVDRTAHTARQMLVLQALGQCLFVFRLCVISDSLLPDSLGEGVSVRQQLHQIFVGIPHPFQNGLALAAIHRPALQLCQEPTGKTAKTLEILPGNIPVIRL